MKTCRIPEVIRDILTILDQVNEAARPVNPQPYVSSKDVKRKLIERFKVELDPLPNHYTRKLVNKCKLLIDHFVRPERNIIDRFVENNPFAQFTPEQGLEIEEMVTAVQSSLLELHLPIGLEGCPDVERAITYLKRKLPLAPFEVILYLVRFALKVIVKIRSQSYRPKKFPTARGAKLFHLVPNFSWQRRFIPVDSITMFRLLKASRILQCRLQDFSGDMYEEWCRAIFNFSKMNKNIKVDEAVNKKNKFERNLVTDGFAACFLFSRPKLDDVVRDLPKEDGRIDGDAYSQRLEQSIIDLGVVEGDQVVVIDPGIRDVGKAIILENDISEAGSGREVMQRIIGSLGNKDLPLQQRSFSTPEYYDMAGFDRSTSARLRRKRTIEGERVTGIEAGIPSRKTAALESYMVYYKYYPTLTCSYIINGGRFTELTSFYDYRYRRLVFLNYQGRQVALEEGAKIFSLGSKKYHVDPVNEPDQESLDLAAPIEEEEPPPGSQESIDSVASLLEQVGVACDPGSSRSRRYKKAPVSPLNPDRRVLVGIGDGKFAANAKGNLSAPVKILWKQLRVLSRRLGKFAQDHPIVALRGRQKLELFDLGEWRTSKMDSDKVAAFQLLLLDPDPPEGKLSSTL